MPVPPRSRPAPASGRWGGRREAAGKGGPRARVPAGRRVARSHVAAVAHAAAAALTRTPSHSCLRKLARVSRWSPHETSQRQRRRAPSSMRGVRTAAGWPCRPEVRARGHPTLPGTWGLGTAQGTLDHVLPRPRPTQFRGPLAPGGRRSGGFWGYPTQRSLHVLPQNPGRRPPRIICHGRFSGKQLCSKSAQAFAWPRLVAAARWLQRRAPRPELAGRGPRPPCRVQR